MLKLTLSYSQWTSRSLCLPLQFIKGYMAMPNDTTEDSKHALEDIQTQRRCIQEGNDEVSKYYLRIQTANSVWNAILNGG